jgi:hypothetical protein
MSIMKLSSSASGGLGIVLIGSDKCANISGDVLTILKIILHHNSNLFSGELFRLHEDSKSSKIFA